MKEVIEALKKEGLRDKVKVMIGGYAVSEEVCKYTGADFWSKNAAASVNRALDYLNLNP
jgi:methanogenic corrinoid protein MtbC1